MSDPCNPNSTVGSPIRRKLQKGAKFNFDFVEMASRMVAAGMTETDLGYVLGVKPGTIKKWKQRYAEFKEACSSGKEIAKQYLVAKGLRAAMGYDYEEVDQVLERNKDGEMYVKKETRKLKHKAVDKDLLIFFLINMARGSGEWRNVKSIEITEKKQNVNIHLSGHIESDTIRKLAGAAIKQAEQMDKLPVIEAEVIDAKPGD